MAALNRRSDLLLVFLNMTPLPPWLSPDPFPAGSARCIGSGVAVVSRAATAGSRLRPAARGYPPIRTPGQLREAVREFSVPACAPFSKQGCATGMKVTMKQDTKKTMRQE